MAEMSRFRGSKLVTLALAVATALVLPGARTLDAGAASPYSYSIWPAPQYIANLAVPDPGSVEVGVKFRSDLAGLVTGVRFYKGPGNTGTHIGNLWNSTGTRLATVTFGGETDTGWQQASFANPVSINANTTYIASYLAPNGHYAATTFAFQGQAVDNPPLHALADGADGPNGLYTYSATSAFPTQSARSNNYWVDVVMQATVTTPPTTYGLSPANGATAAALNSLVSATFSEELRPGTLSASLSGPGGSVPAKVTWELHKVDRIVTLDPLTNLSPGTTYTVSLSGGTDYAGNVMAPVSWSFATTRNTLPAQSAAGQWQPIQKWPLVMIHESLLKTGKLIGLDPQSPTTTSQMLDPSTGSFTSAPMGVDSFCGGQVQLADGRLLVAGGDHGDNDGGALYGLPIKATVIYDPATGAWTRAADMNIERWYPGMLRLGDGRVLAISGGKTNTTWADTPEVYDPQANTWTMLAGVNTADVHEELYPNEFLLPDGKVLTIAVSTGHTWILDVAAQTWTQGPTSPFLNASTVQYRPGKILLSGGTGSKGYGNTSVASAAILDMTVSNPTWQTIAPMNYARTYHQLTVLPDGRVLNVGGSTWMSTSSTFGVQPAEIWDPASNTWTVMASMQDNRMNHSVGALMPDGTFLAAGGGHELGTAAYDYFTAETFSPPYLFGGTRPSITSAPATAGYGASITVQTPDAANVSSVALVGLSAETHHIDMGATYQPLSYTQGSGQLSVTMPATAGLASPGYYMLFLVSSTGVPSIASMVQLSGVDATPPAVSSVTPANGAVNTSASTAPTAAFSKAVVPSSIGFTLTDSSATAVPTTTSYASATNTATFTPQAALKFSTTYTATLKSATDLGGHGMTGPYSWSFTTGAGPSCPCTIWSSSTTPGTASVGDRGSVELGVKFQADLSGYITGVRFYKGAGNTGTHVGNLWTASGTLLGTANFAGETASGWQSVTFADPVPVTANTTYVASYLAPAGGYSFDSGYFTAGNIDNSPLHAMQAGAVSGNGVFTYAPSSAFPSKSNSQNPNYWVDVNFIVTLPPDSTIPQVIQTVPVAGATGVATGTAPTATFNEAVQASSITFTLMDGGGASVAGATSYSSPTKTATFTPAAPLAAGASYTALVSGATDLRGHVMSAPARWSFTTAAMPICPCTLWPASRTPANASANDSNAVELGVKFTSDQSGHISGVRFYKGAGNGGTHVGNLWSSTSQLLASATFSGETATGWQQVSFSTPVAISAGTTYVASYFAPAGHYAYDLHSFDAPYDNAPLHAPSAAAGGGNGVYRYGSPSGFPTSTSGNNTNYWVDVVLTP